MTDERESDRELIGIAPGTIALIMGIITIVVPLGIVPTSYGMSENGLAFIEPIIYGLFWSYVPYWYNPYSFFNIFFTWLTIPLSFLNLLYLRQIVRYYQGKTTKYNAIWAGIFSITIPTILSLATSGIVTPSGIFDFIGPIPIQFLVGLFILYRIPGPELPSAFSSEMEDLDTSVPDRAKVLADVFPDYDDDSDDSM